MDFEVAFERFINRKEYDAAESALFSMIRIAFRAGWLAAGGDPYAPQPAMPPAPSQPEEGPGPPSGGLADGNNERG